MSTDVFDERRFQKQCSLYDSKRVKLRKDSIRLSSTTSTVLDPSTMSTPARHRRVKYPTQINTTSSSTNSIHNRHSASTDILSLIRSFAMKPFKTSSMTNAVAGGQTSNVIGGSHTHNKAPVNLLRYRPLSDVLTDHDSYTPSTHTIEEFLKRMGWPTNTSTDQARVKWNTAMKFLIPSKFDVNRAIELYNTHENLRKTENLDHIWINNTYLIREIQSSKFFPLPQLPNQPLTVIFSASNLENLTPTGSLSLQERELITLQALICQLDVATESTEVQQNGLNFIYDMQSCSATQFDMNLSKKILKLLQGGYPAMLKNLFIVSAPKWFRVVYKVTMCSTDQMREYLITQHGYTLDNVPISLGGTLDPIETAQARYQLCAAKVTDSQSICHPYYFTDYQPLTSKSSSNILIVNSDYSNQEKPITTTTTVTSPSSMLTLVSLRHHPDATTKIRIRKRESSSSSDNDKRPRSNGDLSDGGNESLMINTSASIRKENVDDQAKRNDHTSRVYTGQQDRDLKPSMNGSNHRSLKRETKRSTITNVYKTLSETEFLSKTHSEIRHEFRKMPNPPARDIHAAKDEMNLDKSRYRDVIPGESTRVKLQPDGDDRNDFINANYVSGYNNQERAYIFTQGPLQHTVKDFWRMIWQDNIAIIVMTTNIREAGMMKCYPYWPSETSEQLDSGSYQIRNEKADRYDSFVVTTLLLKKKNHPETRTVYHAHYLKWPDHGIPNGTQEALAFLEKVEYYKQLTKTTAPVLLHCSAGIGRTGTFCAIDIGIKRYLEEKLIDIPSTVMKMRLERSGSVQTEDQYLFAHLALMDFIRQQRAIQERLTSLELTISSKPSETEQTIGVPLINTSKFISLPESFSHRVRKFNGGVSLTEERYFTSSSSPRLPASMEPTGSMPLAGSNGTHRKLRK